MIISVIVMITCLAVTGAVSCLWFQWQQSISGCSAYQCRLLYTFKISFLFFVQNFKIFFAANIKKGKPKHTLCDNRVVINPGNIMWFISRCDSFMIIHSAIHILIGLYNMPVICNLQCLDKRRGIPCRMLTVQWLDYNQ